MICLITCALPLEFNEARNQLGLKEITKDEDKVRIANSRDIYLVCSGIGKINSILNLYSYLESIKPDLVIDSGTCGALNSDIKEFDIVYSNRVIDFYSYSLKGHEYSSTVETSIKELLDKIDIQNRVVASIEDSVVTEVNRKKLSGNGASIVTWETSGIFSLCNKLSIPVLSIRCVTDSCDDRTFVDFKKNRIEACKKLYSSIKNICKGV